MSSSSLQSSGEPEYWRIVTPLPRRKKVLTIYPGTRYSCTSSLRTSTVAALPCINASRALYPGTRSTLFRPEVLWSSLDVSMLPVAESVILLISSWLSRHDGYPTKIRDLFRLPCRAAESRSTLEHEYVAVANHHVPWVIPPPCLPPNPD